LQGTDNGGEPILSSNKGISSLANQIRIQPKGSLSRPVEESKDKLFMRYTISQDMTIGDDSRSKDRLCAIKTRELKIMLR
jgi:hypothetical protein